MKKSLGQIACEAAVKKIEQEQGIKMIHHCIVNETIKPLPDTFEEFMNHDQIYTNMSQREFIIRRELHFQHNGILQEGLNQIVKDKVKDKNDV